MKKMIILLAMVCCSYLANAQKIAKKNVPTAIQTTFQKLYPTVSKVKWEKENENYEASFEVDKKEISLVFDILGGVLETEVEIPVSELPTNIKDYVSKNFAGKKITEAAKMTDAKGTITYEAEVKGKDLIFDAQGNFIK